MHMMWALEPRESKPAFFHNATTHGLLLFAHARCDILYLISLRLIFSMGMNFRNNDTMSAFHNENIEAQ